jgi:hypothetical protein
MKEFFNSWPAWLWASVPMWVMGFASPDFFTGFFFGITLVPVWGVATVLVLMLFDRKKKK